LEATISPARPPPRISTSVRNTSPRSVKSGIALSPSIPAANRSRSDVGNRVGGLRVRFGVGNWIDGNHFNRFVAAGQLTPVAGGALFGVGHHRPVLRVIPSNHIHEASPIAFLAANTL